MNDATNKGATASIDSTNSRSENICIIDKLVLRRRSSAFPFIGIPILVAERKAWSISLEALINNKHMMC